LEAGGSVQGGQMWPPFRKPGSALWSLLSVAMSSGPVKHIHFHDIDRLNHFL
jgi:hypothetical protein